MLFLIAGVVCCIVAVVALWRSPQMPGQWPLLVGAMLPQALGLLGVSVPGAFVLSAILLFAWLWCNRGVAGMPIIALGAFLNFFVMAFHQGSMPILAGVLADYGFNIAPGTIVNGSKDIVVADSALWWLSDWIVLSLRPPYVIFISPGNIVIGLGLIYWLIFSHNKKRLPTSVAT